MLAERLHSVPKVSRYLVTEGHKKQRAAFSGMPKLNLTMSLTDFSLLAIFKNPAQPVMNIALCQLSDSREELY